MRTKKILLFIALFSLLSLSAAKAASLPSLTVVGGGSNVLITVIDADPNSNVSLHYPLGSTESSVNIGTTNSAGYFSSIVGADKYKISPTRPVYVVINGVHSPTATWPNVTVSENTNTSSYTSGSSLYLSQNTVNGIVGQSVSVIAFNVSGSLTVSSNTNSSIATASVSGNTLSVLGISPGNSTMTVCAAFSGCSTMNITIQGSTQTQSATQTYSSIFGTNASALKLNEAKSINLNGIGPYSVSSNSNPGTASATVAGNTLNLLGLAVGNTSITVCQTNGSCGSITVSVAQDNNYQTTLPLAITSFSVTSNKTNDSFLKTGNILTISFNMNQSVIMPVVAVSSQKATVSGSGSGPYTASINLTGNEAKPIQVSLTFSNSSGSASQLYLWLSDSPTGSPPAQTAAVVGSSQNSSSPAAFTSYLYMGMTKLGEVNAEVTALQRFLKADGTYNGPIIGYFGQQTKAAVQAYQKKKGLDPVGAVGPATRAVLNKSI